ncbi:hypothetical protein [Vibrio parahaemolyticus]|uniref:hypothetical protein n=1 Tax=Vibrio parahaemolyticus TaxID=670 RepID=UPI0015DF1FA3|nr:hypothetical protein [Vibrio parahaemolyticus]
MKAKMVVGILALSMIPNGIVSKESTKQIVNDCPILVPQIPTTNAGQLTIKAIR